MNPIQTDGLSSSHASEVHLSPQCFQNGKKEKTKWRWYNNAVIDIARKSETV